MNKKQAWTSFASICETMSVEATEFLSSMIDLSDTNATYAEVRKWLQNEQLLRDQLVMFKNG